MEKIGIGSMFGCKCINIFLKYNSFCVDACNFAMYVG